MRDQKAAFGVAQRVAEAKMGLRGSGFIYDANTVAGEADLEPDIGF
jgi:hypothetical protein